MSDDIDRIILRFRECINITHVIGSFGLPTPRSYRLNEEANILKREGFSIVNYSRPQEHLQLIMDIMSANLSEPYDEHIYKMFLDDYPQLCFLAFDSTNRKFAGAVVGKLEEDIEDKTLFGYIAMLAVDSAYRRRGIGKILVQNFIEASKRCQAAEIRLETEANNTAALSLYESVGFLYVYHLKEYYINKNDAYDLRFYLQHNKGNKSEPRTCRMPFKFRKTAQKRFRSVDL